MDAIEAIRGRRSIRRYLPRLVERRLIEAVIADACCAPWTPASPPDPWVFNVVEGRERVAGYGERALRHVLERRRGAPGYDWAEKPGFSVFHGAPALVIVSGKAGHPLALEECTRAGQIFVLSAHARGLGTCWVGASDLWLKEAPVRAELAIPEGYEPQATFTLGYAAAVPPPPRPVEPRIVWTADHRG